MYETFLYDRESAIIANLSTLRTCMGNEADLTLAGFLAAEYGCDSDAAALLRIGERTLAETPRCWITAWNPLGQFAGATENAAAQQQLISAVRREGRAFDRGFARSPRAPEGEPWNEPCAVIAHARSEFIDALAIAFRQLAVGVAQPGERVHLRCYRRFWLQRFDISDMDAANVEWVA